MKRVLVLLGGIPLLAASLVLSGCGDGVEPRPPAATPTATVPKPTATRAPSNTPTTVPATHTPTETPTFAGPTLTPSETPTQGEATVTPTIGATLCGDGIIEGTETCDDGGICQNGPDHGKPCPSNVADGVDCGAPGVCRPVGGDGCAENCTTETVVDLKLGDTSSSQSMSEVQGKAFGVPLVLIGQLRARAGSPRAEIVTTTAAKTFNPGDIPVVQTVNDNSWTPDTPNEGLPPIAVEPGIACACVRGYAAKSCGAVLPDDPSFIDCSPKCVAPDGGKLCAGGSNPLNPCSVDSDCPGGRCGEPCNPNLSEPGLTAQCGDGYTCTGQDDICTDSTKTCDFIHGPGNQASGVIACGGGYTGPTGDGISYKVVLDSLTGISVRTWSGGAAPAGSALIINSTAIGNITGSNCEFDNTQALNGPDGLPCTDDDLDKSYINTIPLTTGSAEAEVDNANNASGATIRDGVNCGSTPCLTKFTGNAVMCSNLPNASGAALAGAFASEDLAPLGDVAVPSKFVALP